MYPDPNRIRSERVTVRLDQYEHKLLTALAEYQGEQLSTLMRTLLLREVDQVMAEAGPVGVPGMGTTVQGNAA